MPPAMTTTGGKPKAFSWSYSKIKNYDSCPKRHFHVDIAKDVKEEESEQLAYGNTLHKVLADRIAKGTPLPKGYETMEEWAKKVIDGAGINLVEQKYAIRADFTACVKANGEADYFAKDVWFRGIGDVVKLFPNAEAPVVAGVLDWKTGKIVEDSVQLALMAQCLFSRYPTLQKVRTEFIWLKEGATTRADFTRQDMVEFWAGFLPRVAAYQNAVEAQIFPAKPGYLCRRWCPVEKCPHHGE